MPSAEGLENERHEGSFRAGWAAPFGVVALAALVRFHDLDGLGIWVDEANTILIAGQSLPVLLDKLRLDSSPPLFYVVLHFWMRVLGDAGWALRLFSALAGVGLVAAIGWAGRELISRRVGLWAALFAAVSPIQAFYSQQVRMYALLPLLALLSVAFLVRYLGGGMRRHYALWVAFTILALYTHNFAIYLLPMDGVLIALSGRLVRGFGRWALAGALISLAYAPWIPFLLEQLGNRDHYAWFVPYWEGAGLSGIVVRSFLSYSPGQEYMLAAGMGKLETWGGWPTLGVAALAAFGAWRQALRWRRCGLADALWPSAYLLVPIGCALIVSSWLTPHYVPGRVDQMMFPAFALLVGAGIAGLRSTPLRVVVVAAIVAVAGWSRPNPPDEHRPLTIPIGGVRQKFLPQGSDRELAARVVDRWRPGDVILCTSLTRASLEYYLRRAGVEAGLLSFPRDTAEHLGAQNDARWLADRPALAREAAEVMAQARALAGAHARIIVVRVQSRINGSLEDASLERRFGYEQVEHLGHFMQIGTGALIEVAIYLSLPGR